MWAVRTASALLMALAMSSGQDLGRWSRPVEAQTAGDWIPVASDQFSQGTARALAHSLPQQNQLFGSPPQSDFEQQNSEAGKYIGGGAGFNSQDYLQPRPLQSLLPQQLPPQFLNQQFSSPFGHSFSLGQSPIVRHPFIGGGQNQFGPPPPPPPQSLPDSSNLRPNENYYNQDSGRPFEQISNLSPPEFQKPPQATYQSEIKPYKGKDGNGDKEEVQILYVPVETLKNQRSKANRAQQQNQNVNFQQNQNFGTEQNNRPNFGQNEHNFHNFNANQNFESTGVKNSEFSNIDYSAPEVTTTTTPPPPPPPKESKKFRHPIQPLASQKPAYHLNAFSDVSAGVNSAREQKQQHRLQPQQQQQQAQPHQQQQQAQPHHQQQQVQAQPQVQAQQQSPDEYYHPQFSQYLTESKPSATTKRVPQLQKQSHFEEAAEQTLPPPNQPPLSVYMETNENSKIGDVLSLLKDAKTIPVLDNIGAHSPQVFVGPSNLKPPHGYVKFELPYLSSLDGHRVEHKVLQLPFFVAPLNFQPPAGYSKIPFPPPHIGSVVLSNNSPLPPPAAQPTSAYTIPADISSISPQLPSLINNLQVDEYNNGPTPVDVTPETTTLPVRPTVHTRRPSQRGGQRHSVTEVEEPTTRRPVRQRRPLPGRNQARSTTTTTTTTTTTPVPTTTEYIPPSQDDYSDNIGPSGDNYIHPGDDFGSHQLSDTTSDDHRPPHRFIGDHYKPQQTHFAEDDRRATLTPFAEVPAEPVKPNWTSFTSSDSDYPVTEPAQEAIPKFRNIKSQRQPDSRAPPHRVAYSLAAQPDQYTDDLKFELPQDVRASQRPVDDYSVLGAIRPNKVAETNQYEGDVQEPQLRHRPTYNHQENKGKTENPNHFTYYEQMPEHFGVGHTSPLESRPLAQTTQAEPAYNGEDSDTYYDQPRLSRPGYSLSTAERHTTLEYVEPTTTPAPTTTPTTTTTTTTTTRSRLRDRVRGRGSYTARPRTTTELPNYPANVIEREQKELTRADQVDSSDANDVGASSTEEAQTRPTSRSKLASRRQPGRSSFRTSTSQPPASVTSSEGKYLVRTRRPSQTVTTKLSTGRSRIRRPTTPTTTVEPADAHSETSNVDMDIKIKNFAMAAAKATQSHFSPQFIEERPHAPDTDYKPVTASFNPDDNIKFVHRSTSSPNDDSAANFRPYKTSPAPESHVEVDSSADYVPYVPSRPAEHTYKRPRPSIAYHGGDSASKSHDRDEVTTLPYETNDNAPRHESRKPFANRGQYNEESTTVRHQPSRRLPGHHRQHSAANDAAHQSERLHNHRQHDHQPKEMSASEKQRQAEDFWNQAVTIQQSKSFEYDPDTMTSPAFPTAGPPSSKPKGSKAEYDYDDYFNGADQKTVRLSSDQSPFPSNDQQFTYTGGKSVPGELGKESQYPHKASTTGTGPSTDRAPVDSSSSEEEVVLPAEEQPKMSSRSDDEVGAPVTQRYETSPTPNKTSRRRGTWVRVKVKKLRDVFETAESQSFGALTPNAVHTVEKAKDAEKPSFVATALKAEAETPAPVTNLPVLETTEQPSSAKETTTDYFRVAEPTEPSLPLTTTTIDEAPITTTEPPQAEVVTSAPSLESKVLGTSTTTEISLETEICYRGRCVKTRKAPKKPVADSSDLTTTD